MTAAIRTASFRTLGICWRRTSPFAPTLNQIAALIREIAGQMAAAELKAPPRTR
jgi:hypothetical protein